MALRDKLRANAAPYLQPGEVIEEIFSAQTKNQYWAVVLVLLAGISVILFFIWNSYRIVVVTNRRILVLYGGKMKASTVNGELSEWPRNTKIGPATGTWYRFESLGERLYVHSRFHQDIARADGALPPLGL